MKELLVKKKDHDTRLKPCQEEADRVFIRWPVPFKSGERAFVSH
jgi:hypothetical protein